MIQLGTGTIRVLRYFLNQNGLSQALHCLENAPSMSKHQKCPIKFNVLPRKRFGHLTSKCTKLHVRKLWLVNLTLRNTLDNNQAFIFVFIIKTSTTKKRTKRFLQCVIVYNTHMREESLLFYIISLFMMIMT